MYALVTNKPEISRETPAIVVFDTEPKWWAGWSGDSCPSCEPKNPSGNRLEPRLLNEGAFEGVREIALGELAKLESSICCDCIAMFPYALGIPKWRPIAPPIPLELFRFTLLYVAWLAISLFLEAAASCSNIFL